MKGVFWQRHLYPLVAGLGLLAWGIADRLAWNAEAVVMAWAVFVLGLAVWLERRWPHARRWQAPVAGDTRRVDAPSALLVVAVVEPLMKVALPMLALMIAAQAPSLQKLWPTQAPWAFQWLLALLASELARYAMHRALHEWPLLWRLHALHHGAERLYWLNNFRVHPLNLVLVHMAAWLPLRLLGAPAELLLAVLAFTQPVVLLQHANIALRSGVWNGLFSTNEAHRWHHSDQPHEANANYGSALLVWDHVFGSFRAAGARAEPARIGLFANSTGYPARASLWRQLMPVACWRGCRPACCRA